MNSMNGFTGTVNKGPTGASKGYDNKIPSGYKYGQLQQFTPEQTQLFQQLFSHVSPNSYLSKLAGGDEEIFKQIEGPALREFQGLQGQLGSRFSGMGLGGRHSSGFQNTATAAAGNLAENLAAKRQQLQRQAIMDLMGISHSLLGQRPYEQFLVPKQQKQSSGIGGLLGGALGGLGGFFAGGPLGALSGSQFGNKIGSQLF